MKTVSEMTVKEREEMNDTIYSMIGDRDQFHGLPRDEYCAKSAKWHKVYKQLVKIAEKYGVKGLKATIVFNGDEAQGKTASGKDYYYYMNRYGVTERCWYCGTLMIDGKTKFTSGGIAKVVEYLMNN